ncbi:unnamed protein product [Sphagnum balticum]
MAHFLRKRSGELAMQRILSLHKRVQASSKPQELHSFVLHVHTIAEEAKVAPSIGQTTAGEARVASTIANTTAEAPAQSLCLEELGREEAAAQCKESDAEFVSKPLSPKKIESTKSEKSSSSLSTPNSVDDLKTAPMDWRFPTTNQAKHCYTSYNEFHKCAAEKGEDANECQKYAKYYRSLCPAEWIEKWNEERANDTFPGRY